MDVFVVVRVMVVVVEVLFFLLVPVLFPSPDGCEYDTEDGYVLYYSDKSVSERVL